MEEMQSRVHGCHLLVIYSTPQMKGGMMFLFSLGLNLPSLTTEGNWNSVLAGQSITSQSVLQGQIIVIIFGHVFLGKKNTKEIFKKYGILRSVHLTLFLKPEVKHIMSFYCWLLN